MKKLLIITSAIFLLAAACNKQAVVQPASNQQTSNSTDQTANWKTYTNTQYGFEFQYPSDMIITADAPSGRFGTGVNYSVSQPDSKWSYGVDVKANTSNQTLKQVFDENYNTWKSIITSGSDFQLKDFYTLDIKVVGIDAKELYIDHFSDIGSTMVSVIYKGYTYMIAGGVNKGDLDQFLSTFKFTK